MGYFPFYMDIEGKLCVIAGGGKVAYRKVCDLLPFGATIKVVSPEWNAGLSALAEEPSFGSRLKLYRRLFSVEDDLADADFVIAASSDEVLNAKISDDCRQKKIPVNVVDVKDECSFIFPSMLKEGPVNIAISSGGASPVLTQIIKERIRQVIPEHTGEIAEQLGSLRPEILSLFPESSQKRKEVFKKMATLAAEQDQPLTREQIDEIIADEEPYDRT